MFNTVTTIAVLRPSYRSSVTSSSELEYFVGAKFYYPHALLTATGALMCNVNKLETKDASYYWLN